MPRWRRSRQASTSCSIRRTLPPWPRHCSAALASGRLSPARVEEAQRRYERALLKAGTAPAPAARAPFDGAPALADALVAAGVTRARLPHLRAPIELVTVDDDLGGPYAPVPSDTVAATLACAGRARWAREAAASCWRSRSRGHGRVAPGFSAASRAALEELVPGSDLDGPVRSSAARGGDPRRGAGAGGLAPPAADAGRGRPLAQ